MPIPFSPAQLMSFILIMAISTSLLAAFAIVFGTFYRYKRHFIWRFSLKTWWIFWAIFLIKGFVFDVFYIPSSSMRDGLHPGDYIFINRLQYEIKTPIIYKTIFNYDSPKFGDVIVFRNPNKENVDFIKRVIGVPGDTIKYVNKKLFINNKEVNEVKLNKEKLSYLDDGQNIKVDIFKQAFDGRSFTILKSDIMPNISLTQLMVGTPPKECKYFTSGFSCVVPKGTYFVLGDNRDFSFDSRYWGFVPSNNITGRAHVLIFNIADLFTLNFKRWGLIQ